jgi:hypothetical protein
VNQLLLQDKIDEKTNSQMKEKHEQEDHFASVSDLSFKLKIIKDILDTTYWCRESVIISALGDGSLRVTAGGCGTNAGEELTCIPQAHGGTATSVCLARPCQARSPPLSSSSFPPCVIVTTGLDGVIRGWLLTSRLESQSQSQSQRKSKSKSKSKTKSETNIKICIDIQMIWSLPIDVRIYDMNACLFPISVINSSSKEKEWKWMSEVYVATQEGGIRVYSQTL